MGGGRGLNEISEGVFAREVLFPRDFLGVQPPLLGLMPLWVGPHSTKYLGKRTSRVQNHKMVGFGMGEGLHGRAFAVVNITVGSWWDHLDSRCDLSHGKGPAVGASPCKTPHKAGLVQSRPHKAHFAGVGFLHLSQLASTLFQKKKKTKKSQYVMVRFDNQSWILFVRV